MGDPIFFRDLLRDGHWTITEGGYSVDPPQLRRVVSCCAKELERRLVTSEENATRPIIVFFTNTQLEAIIAYCVASELGLLAVVASLRRAPTVLNYLQLRRVGKVVIPAGAKMPEGIPDHLAVRLNFAVCPSNTPHTFCEISGRRPGADFIFFTSGSTGVPKLVVCSEARLVTNARKVAGYLGLSRSDRTLCLFPVTYMYGLSTLLCSMCTSGTIVFANWATPSLIVQAIIESEITVLPIVGDWAIELTLACRQSLRRVPKLQVLNASDRLLKIQAEHLLSIAKRLWNNYGQTESGPRLLALEITNPRDLDRFSMRGVVAPGLPIDGRIELEIRNSAQRASPTVGNLYYSTPFAMRGYLQSDMKVECASKWINSGDLFFRSKTGVFFWLERAARAIKYNGEYLFVNDVVDIIIRRGCVSQASFRKSERGELLFFVTPPKDRPLALKEIDELLGRVFFGRKYRLEVVSSLPKTESGKVDISAVTTQPGKVSVA